jgi:hypothetical protein
MSYIWNHILRFSRCSKKQVVIGIVRNCRGITKVLLKPFLKALMEKK